MGYPAGKLLTIISAPRDHNRQDLATTCHLPGDEPAVAADALL
jgi:hypothetical protein